MYCVTLEIALIMKGIIGAIREGGWKGCVYVYNAHLALKKAIRELKREMCIFLTWKLWSDVFFFDPNQVVFALTTLICAKIANSPLSYSIFHLVVPFSPPFHHQSSVTLHWGGPISTLGSHILSSVGIAQLRCQDYWYRGSQRAEAWLQPLSPSFLQCYFAGS